MIKQENLQWSKIDSFVGNFTDSSLLMYRPCPICGSIEQKTLLVFDDFQFFSDSESQPKRVQIKEVQCRSCHGIFLNPRYSNVGFDILFAEAGCSYGSTAERPKEQLSWLRSKGLLEKGCRLLDVGCYDGRFLAQMPEGVRCFGVDIDRHAIERGQQYYGAQGMELLHGDFDRVRLSQSPDVITMFHVLEHLPDPVATLRNLRDQAAAGCVLVVEVPILENGFTNDINGFFSVQHMTHFSRASFRNVLLRGGWELIEVLEQPDYNGCRVLAQPVSVVDQVAGTIDDCNTLSAYQTHYIQVLQSVNERIETLGDVAQIVLWGGGLHSEFLYQQTELFAPSQRRFIVVDSDPIKQGKSWRGLPVYAPNVLQSVAWRDARLVISSYGGQPAIAKAALELGVPLSCLLKLYEQLWVY